jgi:chemotaxis protein methyltransferase CheR
MSEIQITAEDFQQFREYFYRRTGIYFDDSKRYFVDRRLIERIKINGETQFRRYFTYLRFQASGAEFQALTNSLTVNETYFFREASQLRCLVESILPEVLRRKRAGQAIRIWCVPSSSGEEPYSIAIHLLEFWPDLARWDVEIVGSDIDTDILSAAARGVYSKRSVQNLPPALLAKYFDPCDEDAYALRDDVKDVITFTQVNIADMEQTRSYRDFDVIFCRNLLIYFDDLSRRKAAEMFFDALLPGGFICLGHSESMSRITPIFRVRKFPDNIVYQRPEEA